MNLRETLALDAIRNEKVTKSATPIKLKNDMLKLVSEQKRGLLRSEKFYLVEVPLHALASLSKHDPHILTIRAASLNSLRDEQGQVIVADINATRLGETAFGYHPPVIVIEGGDIHAAARFVGKERIKAWIGHRAAVKLKLIHADHQLGSGELQSLLNEQMRLKFPPKKNSSGMVTGPTPWITEVYPFENYCIYSYDGEQFKMTFAIDMDKRTVKLTGKPQRVVQKYVDLNAKGGGSMKMEETLGLHGMGGGLGGGSGANPNNPTQMKVGNMRTKKKPFSGKKKLRAKRLKAEFTNLPYGSSKTVNKKVSPGQESDMVKRPRLNHPTLDAPTGPEARTKATDSTVKK